MFTHKQFVTEKVSKTKTKLVVNICYFAIYTLADPKCLFEIKKLNIPRKLDTDGVKEVISDALREYDFTEQIYLEQLAVSIHDHLLNGDQKKLKNNVRLKRLLFNSIEHEGMGFTILFMFDNGLEKAVELNLTKDVGDLRLDIIRELKDFDLMPADVTKVALLIKGWKPDQDQHSGQVYLAEKE